LKFNYLYINIIFFLKSDNIKKVFFIKLYKEIIDILKKDEKEFIYNSLGIENFSKYSFSPFRFWFNDFRKNHKKRNGDIYEFGVYKGSSLIAIALLAKMIGSQKHFWGFDSFSGFPQFSEKDKLCNFSEEYGFSKDHLNDIKLLEKIKLTKNEIEENNILGSLTKLGKSGVFKDTSHAFLLEKIEKLELNNITLVKGDFKDTIDNHFNERERIIFSANLDCDLYSGYKVCLPIIFKHLVSGGYIHIDEYYSLKYPGARIATDEFLKKNKEVKLKINKTRDAEFNRYYITK